jgi:hypothetical protein
MLHNPFYAGAYFYGKRRAVNTLDPETKTRRTVLRWVPLESLEVLIREAHPAYITWDEFLASEGRLRENWSMPEGGGGAVRSGAALLQGIIYCSRCGRRMSLCYAARRYPIYQCKQKTPLAREVYCQMVSATRIDSWVEERILEAVQPMGIEAALAAVEELERRSEEMRRQWEHRIEQAEYEAALARRRYEQVDPDNRLVAGNLERDWEEKLRHVAGLRKEYAERAEKPPIRLSEEDRRRVHELARDLPRLWRAKTTKQADRKRVVRILVRDVWVAKMEDKRTTQIRIHWQTGAVTEGEVKWRPPETAAFTTPEKVVERIRELLARSDDLEGIAATQNREGLKTGRGNEFTAARVRTLVERRKIEPPGPKPKRATSH